MSPQSSNKPRECQAFIFPISALASEAKAWTWVFDTIERIREGRADLKELDGIRELALLRQHKCQLRQAERERHLVERIKMRIQYARVWLRREYMAWSTARRLAR
jgi:hypothetical protein